MATNISTTQAAEAVSALHTTTTIDRSPSPITSMHAGTASSYTVNTAHSVPVSRPPSQFSARTEELILSELQKLSARMTQVEQDLQTDTFTSTPRKRKKAKTRGRRGENSMIGGPGNVTDNQTTFEESAASLHHNSRVVIPVHTQHTTRTTSVTTTSLFSQNNPLVPQQIRGTGTSNQTQVVFSTCQSMHPGQHVANRLPVSQGQVTGSGQSTHTGEVRQPTNQPMGSVPYEGQTIAQGMGGQGQGNSIEQTRTTIPPQQLHPVSTHPQYNHAIVQDINRGNSHVLPGVTPVMGPSNMQGGASYHQSESRGLPTNRQTNQQDIIPSLQALRTTAVNQDLVQRRLEELQQQAVPQAAGNSLHIQSHHQYNSNSTNHRKGKKEKVEVVWPQDCAFVGHLRSRVTYEQLTQAQFVLGYLRSVQEEDNPFIRANMVDYLTELFQNTCDFGWQAAKGAHLVVMTKMEEGLVSWADLKKVNKVRKTYVRSAGGSTNSSTDNNNYNNKKATRKPSSMPCKEFQEGKCSKQQDHEVGLITHKHICAYCLYTLNRMYRHSENVCNNKKRSKNGQHPHPQQQQDHRNSQF